MPSTEHAEPGYRNDPSHAIQIKHRNALLVGGVRTPRRFQEPFQHRRVGASQPPWVVSSPALLRANTWTP